MTAPSMAPTMRVPVVATSPGREKVELAPEEEPPETEVLDAVLPLGDVAVEAEAEVGVGVDPLTLILIMLDAEMIAPFPMVAVLTQLLLLGAGCGGGVGPPPWWYVDAP